MGPEYTEFDGNYTFHFQTIGLPYYTGEVSHGIDLTPHINTVEVVVVVSTYGMVEFAYATRSTGDQKKDREHLRFRARDAVYP